jgi:predicted nuclease of predicted toxin-antitoxin system
VIKFLADENFPGPIVRALRTLGYDVLTLSAVVRGAGDLQLLALGVSEQRILLTQDKDFAEFVLNGGHACYGAVQLNVANKGGWRARADGLAAHLDAAQDQLTGGFFLLDETGLRPRSR